LKDFVLPNPWLEQIALRIDLMAHWRSNMRLVRHCRLAGWQGPIDDHHSENLLLNVLRKRCRMLPLGS